MYIIRYKTKVTKSNNNYYQIDKQDIDWLLGKLIQVQSYMGELSITKDVELKEIVKWYTSPNKTLPYSTYFKKNNSPNSMVSGIINNLLYGTQQDISEIQAEHLQYIINTFTDLSSEADIPLQQNCDTQPVVFAREMFQVI